MTKNKKDKILQEIFDNDPMGILDDKIQTKKMPDDWWNHGINPIVGYSIPRNHERQRVRNKFEYVPEDDYNPNED